MVVRHEEPKETALRREPLKRIRAAAVAHERRVAVHRPNIPCRVLGVEPGGVARVHVARGVAVRHRGMRRAVSQPVLDRGVGGGLGPNLEGENCLEVLRIRRGPDLKPQRPRSSVGLGGGSGVGLEGDDEVELRDGKVAPKVQDHPRVLVRGRRPARVHRAVNERRRRRRPRRPPAW